MLVLEVFFYRKMFIVVEVLLNETQRIIVSLTEKDFGEKNQLKNIFQLDDFLFLFFFHR